MWLPQAAQTTSQRHNRALSESGACCRLGGLLFGSAQRIHTAHLAHLTFLSCILGLYDFNPVVLPRSFTRLVRWLQRRVASTEVYMSPAQTIALLLGCLAAPTVYAFDVNAPPAELVLDGALTEWGEPTLTLGGGQHVSGEVAANANDIRARVWLAFDAEGLVVAAEVHDDAVMAGDQLQVRLASTSRRENASPAFDAHFEPVISLVAAQPSHRFAGGYRVERRIALAQLPWLMGPSLSSLAVTLTLTDVDAGERTEPTVLSTQDGGLGFCWTSTRHFKSFRS